MFFHKNLQRPIEIEIFLIIYTKNQTSVINKYQ